MAPDYYRALESVSIASALSTALTIVPMPDPSPSTPTVLNSNFLQLGRSGGRPQRTVYPRRLPVNTVIHTTLAGIELTTFRLLVRRGTGRATETTCLNSVSPPGISGALLNQQSRQARATVWLWCLPREIGFH